MQCQPGPTAKTKFANCGQCRLGEIHITAPLSDIPLCAGCGRCCHLVVALRDGDSVPEEFVIEHNGVRCMEQRGDGACVALDAATQLCTIYDGRPQTCRDFARGESLCRRILACAAAQHE